MFAMSRARLVVALVAWLAFAAVLALAAFSSTASADHSWSNYHWGRKTATFTLGLENNLTAGSPWLQYLQTTSSSDKNDWSDSTVLDAKIVDNEAWTSDCPATSGRVKVCNKEYGDNGWLGLATVWVSGGHITQGTAKMNDTYFNTATYNTPAWRNLVMCQEVGHTFGLGHQDEVFDNPNLGSCMDYTNDPSGALYNQANNEHPNLHDYQLLEEIYAHLEGTTGGASTPAAIANADLRGQAQWGKLVHEAANGRSALYERDFGEGHKVITFVFWADGHHDDHAH